MRYALIVALAGCAVPAGGPSIEARTTVGGESPLASVFARVAKDSGVPADVLAATSYIETRLAFAKDSDLHQVGPLALTDGVAASPRDLHRGAALAGVTDDAARTDYEASLRAGAALLHAAAKNGDYVTALRTYGGETLAREVTDR